MDWIWVVSLHNISVLYYWGPVGWFGRPILPYRANVSTVVFLGRESLPPSQCDELGPGKVVPTGPVRCTGIGAVLWGRVVRRQSVRWADVWLWTLRSLSPLSQECPPPLPSPPLPPFRPSRRLRRPPKLVCLMLFGRLRRPSFFFRRLRRPFLFFWSHGTPLPRGGYPPPVVSPLQ